MPQGNTLVHGECEGVQLSPEQGCVLQAVLGVFRTEAQGQQGTQHLREDCLSDACTQCVMLRTEDAGVKYEHKKR